MVFPESYVTVAADAVVDAAAAAALAVGH